MSEIEKMYILAGIRKGRMSDEDCAEYCLDYECKNCRYNNYPLFTAEKQIEIVKAISTNHISSDYSYKYLGIDRDEIDGEIYLNLCIDGEKYHAHDKDFAVALAKLVNLIWQDLTEEEKASIKNILEM